MRLEKRNLDGPAMIFSGSHNGRTHIEMIKTGEKTRTRRLLVNEKVSKKPHYKVGHDYSIQPGRTKLGILDGRVLILDLNIECKNISTDYPITIEEAQLEGGYTPEQYEKLFESMYKGWIHRVAYNIRYIKVQTMI